MNPLSGELGNNQHLIPVNTTSIHMFKIGPHTVCVLVELNTRRETDVVIEKETDNPDTKCHLCGEQSSFPLHLCNDPPSLVCHNSHL